MRILLPLTVDEQVVDPRHRACQCEFRERTREAREGVRSLRPDVDRCVTTREPQTRGENDGIVAKRVELADREQRGRESREVAERPDLWT